MMHLLALIANVALAGEDTEELKFELVIPVPVGASIIVLVMKTHPD